MKYAEVMLHCTYVNAWYNLPAGFDAVAGLYRRLAWQSQRCARAWAAPGLPCPPHEPATSAFWWGVVAWADAFGRRLGLDEAEWYSKFVAPHRDFAWYLRPYQRGVHPPRDLLKSLNPDGPWLLELDARWTALVIKLTARWGVLHHLKDLRALWQALRLMRELRRTDSPVARAYLKSDIQFFRELFKPFDFSDETRGKIDHFLARAEKDIDFAQWLMATFP